jgi:hypothetical protein
MFPKRRSNSGDFEVFEEAEGVSDLCLEGREEERERETPMRNWTRSKGID